MQTFLNNLSQTDAYKLSHWKQYPKNTEYVYSYFESRGTEKRYDFKETVFFGLQYLLDTIAGEFVKTEDINKMDNRCRRFFGNDQNFNRAGWEYIRDNYQGRLPVEIKALPEGSVVPTHNCLLTVQNTDPKCFWLTNWLETLLTHVWYPSSAATQSREMKKKLLAALEKSGDPAGIEFKLHDFGCRGVSCMQQAAVGGAAHLVNFRGTDTMPALDFIEEYYDEIDAGNSIPASEHSTITSWGEKNELAAMENMLNMYPDGLVACVSDSFDIFQACDKYWGTALRDKILQRNGCLVIRPDSGDPIDVILKILTILENKFPVTINSKGYKVLDPHVRLIQGDGIDIFSLQEILDAILDKGWSADNIAFGSGGGLLQKLNRDINKYAFKCSSVIVDGQQRDVFKRPITDNGKRSKSGCFKVKFDENTGYQTLPIDHLESIKNKTNSFDNLLQTVFLNGQVVRRHYFSEIRERAKI